jgi:transposase
MERVERNTKIAGIDVGKRWLDVAVHGQGETRRFGNDETGHEALIGWLTEQGVVRAGLEATAGYERQIRTRLEAVGLEVVVHQPLEVRLFARLKRWKAKTDALDAALIAAATAQVDTVRAAQDPRLVELAQRLTAYEQITDQAAAMKTFMEHVDLPDLIQTLDEQIQSLSDLKARLADQILEQIKACPDLLTRHRLLMSLPGVGPIVAASLRDCQEFRVKAGHDGNQGETLWPDAKSPLFRMRFWTSYWLGPTPRQLLTLEGCSTA